MSGMMKNLAQPLGLPRTVRNRAVSVVTSSKAGKFVPLVAKEVLREDSMRTSRIRIAAQLAETVRPVFNPVVVEAQAWFVPWIACERFDGRDDFDRKYAGEGENFFLSHAYSNAYQFYKALGVHAVEGEQINQAYLEAYNMVVNFQRQNRSDKIAQRTLLQHDLAEAFWPTSPFAHVVPDYEVQMLDPEVNLFGANASMKVPVSGIGLETTALVVEDPAGLASPAGSFNPTRAVWAGRGTVGTRTWLDLGDAGMVPKIYAEMAQSGIRLTLGNIALAEKTQAYAQLRRKYSGVAQELFIDLLMDGIRIADQDSRLPVLVGQTRANMMFQERFATDGSSLDDSVTQGRAVLDMTVRFPRMNTGGVFLIIASVVPEPMFERCEDPFLKVTQPHQLPQAQRDMLNVELADTVKNREVDVLHEFPNHAFGFAPRNAKWAVPLVRVGGKYMRQPTGVPSAERARIWTAEAANPSLANSFYIVQSLPTDPFLDTAADQVEWNVAGTLVQEGFIQFGQPLVEDRAEFFQTEQKVDDDPALEGHIVDGVAVV